MPRLVHLSAYTPAQVGSFIPFLRAVLLEARARGWSVDAVFPEEAREHEWVGELRDAEIPVHFASGTRAGLIGQIRALLSQDSEPTILHTHFTGYDIAAAIAARRRANVRVFWHVHSVLSDRPALRASNTLKFSIFGRYVTRILSPSADVAANVRRRMGDPAGKVQVFPNAIDTDAYPKLSPEERSLFREQMEIGEDREVLLHFGRHWHIKDGDIFLDALAVLAERGRPVVGLVNQGGEEALQGARERGIAQNLRLTGMLPRANAFYGAADVLVACSRGEAMPYSVIESLCSGTPVVASDLPGHRYLGDELDACTIVPRDAEQMASSIADFLDMGPEGRADLCDTAREWIRQRLDVGPAATRLVDAYEETSAESPKIWSRPMGSLRPFRQRPRARS